MGIIKIPFTCNDPKIMLKCIIFGYYENYYLIGGELDGEIQLKINRYGIIDMWFILGKIFLKFESETNVVEEYITTKDWVITWDKHGDKESFSFHVRELEVDFKNKRATIWV